jgi:hypothetical protein
LSAAEGPEEAGPSAAPQRPPRGRKRLWNTAAAVGIAGLVLAGLQFSSDQCWLGLGSCPTETPDIRIDTASSVFNARGDDDPSEEYVCLVNASDQEVDLASWQLREGSGDVVNTFPSYFLAPGAKVRVHPGEGRDSRRDLFGTSGSPVWTNSGDSVTLVDADGNQIASVSYGEQEEGETAGTCK